MKVLILGGSGMLGHKLVQTLSPQVETWSTVRGPFTDFADIGIFDRQSTIDDVDVRDFPALAKTISELRPDVVINAVGVIKQVPASKDMVELITINSILPHKLSEMSAELGFRLICISTDCVFAGDRGNYGEFDPADAIDVYGKSKHLGEVASGNCLTLRTSIIGRELSTSHSLVEWFLGQSTQVRGFSRAIYTGFPTIVLAEIIGEVITRYPALSGVYHVSSEPISKLDLLRLINEEFGRGLDIVDDDSFTIDRSLDSSAFREITGFRPDSWRQMVNRMAADPTPYEQIRSRAGSGPAAAGSV